MGYSLIANSGIQLFTFTIEIDTNERGKMWFYEWFNKKEATYVIEPVCQVQTNTGVYYYRMSVLSEHGFLADPKNMTVANIKGEGIDPLKVDDKMQEGVEGIIYSMNFADRNCRLTQFENVWLPLPYFYHRSEYSFDVGPMNWTRMKLCPRKGKKSSDALKTYDIILAVDTRAKYEGDEYYECPTFAGKFSPNMNFDLCDVDSLLLEFCTPNKESNEQNVNEYLFRLAYPAHQRISQIKGENAKRMLHIATFIYLIKYFAHRKFFPTLTMYRDVNVDVKDVDMVIDIGNSRTTALLIEDNRNFNQVRKLELVDYTNMIMHTAESTTIRTYDEPFDMRLAFRKVHFGDLGFRDSSQFVYPSFVRLGREARTLIRLANRATTDKETLSTYSSPKRYLWDKKQTNAEWRFLVLDGEKDDHVLIINGITNYLKSSGQVSDEDTGGTSYNYSRRTLMTFAFMEMITQARVQLNGVKHRSEKTGLGYQSMPRKIRRIIVTCPTAMSKVEREALVKCAEEAVFLLNKFEGDSTEKVEVIPRLRSMRDEDSSWYYDEATCTQLVYMYGEAGHKYKGNCSEFFNLYGKREEDEDQSSICIASLDIGAGTTDMMISKYSYNTRNNTVKIIPDPQFYDSFYYAGDDMLYALIRDIMIFSEESSFRTQLSSMSFGEYRQLMKNLLGPDHNDQHYEDRMIRKDFNIQYSVPLMYYFLELLGNDSKDCEVKYNDVFQDCPVNPHVVEWFKSKAGIDITTLSWRFDNARVTELVTKEFEPLVKKIATIMYCYASDVVLLSGRPASLPPIRNLFLKYYSVSPNRLILLNNYYVGDWYPFGENTGYIRDSKTIVAMGGVLAHYAAELSNRGNFIIDLSKLNQNLRSTVNYIENFITPEKHSGLLTVTSLPTTLKVRQVDMPSYPSRTLYSIDFNRDMLSNENINNLRSRMPFEVSIERDPEDKESLSITEITDKNGNEVFVRSLEINIQSLGANDQYWLDSGAFDF